MPVPIFSERQKENNNESINVRCNVDKKIWLSFKTLVGLKRLDITDVLSQILREWVINFGDVKYICYNCGMVMNKENSYVIIRNGQTMNCCSIRCFGTLCIDIKEELWQ